jgi:hypothetical protein
MDSGALKAGGTRTTRSVVLPLQICGFLFFAEHPSQGQMRRFLTPRSRTQPSFGEYYERNEQKDESYGEEDGRHRVTAVGVRRPYYVPSSGGGARGVIVRANRFPGRFVPVVWTLS